MDPLFVGIRQSAVTEVVDTVEHVAVVDVESSTMAVETNTVSVSIVVLGLVG